MSATQTNPRESAIAQRAFDFVVAKRKASEENPLKLGNVEFWHEVPGFTAGILCYSLPVERWDIKAVQDDLNKEAEANWDELVAFLKA